MIQYLRAGGVCQHRGLPDRWCEPDSLLMSPGCGGTWICLILGLLWRHAKLPRSWEVRLPLVRVAGGLQHLGPDSIVLWAALDAQHIPAHPLPALPSRPTVTRCTQPQGPNWTLFTFLENPTLHPPGSGSHSLSQNRAQNIKQKHKNRNLSIFLQWNLLVGASSVAQW